MNHCRHVPRIALAVLGVLVFSQAHADTTSTTGSFTADNSFYLDAFTVTTPTTYTFATTSAAAGNFLPTLTLFSIATGMPVDFNDNTYPGGDVSLSDTLAAGSYDLYLTEYPNVASTTLTGGFLFSSDPTATGDYCGIGAVSFVNAETCASSAQLGKNYTLNTTTAAVTPEPSTFLLMLAPAAGLIEMARRRRTGV